MHGTVGKLNRALAMLLSILMLVTALPVSAFAETDKTAPEETVAAVTAAETPAQEGEGDAAPAADPTVAPEAPAPNAAVTAAPAATPDMPLVSGHTDESGDHDESRSFYPTDTTAPQDIFIDAYANENAQSLVVTGDITSDPGSIRVWAKYFPHYIQNHQFAVLKDGNACSGLTAFRNAQSNQITENPMRHEENTPMYLYGVARDGLVYWSGSMELEIIKEITGDFADPTAEFTFTVTVTNMSVGDQCDYTRYEKVNGEWVLAHAGSAAGKLTVTTTGATSASLILTPFTLRGDQKIIISIPRGISVTVFEECGLSIPSYQVTGEVQLTGDGSVTPSFAMNVDNTVIFTNEFKAAAPTDITFRMAPLVTMLLMGLALTSMILPRRRKRKEEED